MNILYVGDKYDYMRANRGLSYGYYNFYDSLVKMNNGLNNVAYFAIDELIQSKSKAEVNAKLREAADEQKPHIIFFAVGGEIGDVLEKETLRILSKKEGTATVAWMSDDQWAFDAYSGHWAPYFNWVVTTDYKAPAKYKHLGYTNVIKSQWACNHWLYKKLPLPKVYDVSFVGSRHGNRGKMVQEIEKAGIKVECWGSGWPNGRVSQEKMMEIFSQSKICLNFTKNSGVLQKELLYVFARRRMHDRKILWNTPSRVIDNIKAFRAAMWNNQIKGRNFEIPGCGSFCLTEHVEDIESYYGTGKEIDCFSTSKEAAEKIRYYLSHEEAREAIAQAGYERTLREHTYEKRFNEIFDQMGLDQKTV